MGNYSELVGFIWSIAEILRGNYKQSEYGKVILPFTVLRRLDCVLEPTKQAVLEKVSSLPRDIDATMSEVMLGLASGHKFYTTSKYTFPMLLNEPENIAANLNDIINKLSEDVREIFVEKFELPVQIALISSLKIDPL
ncbi:type I restriction-modification system subunit M N-terminal domain-containing protein [Legionella sp. 31fI33]|uniref:type I restriction-modification system subunit M N-terminal domain-containing protein n=1 Tax=Legionella sp. 31fI33 TaxID=2886376 RepID=UPI001E3B5B9F|nr:type I restriction-modification system subunit M N-terminal domain-containing protein [Legionella sp. 31fI33]MCC5015775.1 type I restriction-modification system subunit M N-terminal domain-containing protein [Legionella sp. 31fI33]